MAGENDDIKKEEAGNNEENKDENKRHNWISGLIDKVDNLDIDFPLSGGEEPDHSSPKTEEELEEERKKMNKKSIIFYMIWTLNFLCPVEKYNHAKYRTRNYLIKVTSPFKIVVLLLLSPQITSAK